MITSFTSAFVYLASGGMAFFGEFDHKIDPKGRMNLPAQYRDAFSDGGFMTFLPPRTALFTPSGWEEYQEKLADAGVLNREEMQLIMALTSEFKPDAQNRIVISAKTRERSNLKELVTVVGAQTYLSIWDRDEWAAQQARLLGESDGGMSLTEKFRNLGFA